MDYAVIQTGSKQYIVSKGTVLSVEKLAKAEEGSKIVFKDVRLVRQGDKVMIGAPRLEKATVSGEVVALERGPKVVIYKKKRRKGFNKKTGHRQELTKVRIDKIEV